MRGHSTGNMDQNDEKVESTVQGRGVPQYRQEVKLMSELPSGRHPAIAKSVWRETRPMSQHKLLQQEATKITTPTLSTGSGNLWWEEETMAFGRSNTTPRTPEKGMEEDTVEMNRNINKEERKMDYEKKNTDRNKETKTSSLNWETPKQSQTKRKAKKLSPTQTQHEHQESITMRILIKKIEDMKKKKMKEAERNTESHKEDKRKLINIQGCKTYNFTDYDTKRKTRTGKNVLNRYPEITEEDAESSTDKYAELTQLTTRKTKEGTIRKTTIIMTYFCDTSRQDGRLQKEMTTHSKRNCIEAEIKDLEVIIPQGVKLSTLRKIIEAVYNDTEINIKIRDNNALIVQDEPVNLTMESISSPRPQFDFEVVAGPSYKHKHPDLLDKLTPNVGTLRGKLLYIFCNRSLFEKANAATLQ
ncbi:hypothetical protein FQR65_LT11457 [Abscondita terminalis]|nr:hypothetical protein FQR65_LT11457 [Abscondita terminalis]